MDDNEFKLDFDFEKEYGFNPDDFLGKEEGDFDYSEFLEEDPSKEGDSSSEPVQADFDAPAEPEEEYADEEEPLPAEDGDFAEPEYDSEQSYDEEEPYADAEGAESEDTEEDFYEEPEETDSEDEEYSKPVKKKKGKSGGKLKLPSVKLPNVKIPKLSGLKFPALSGKSVKENDAGADATDEGGTPSRRKKKKSTLAGLVDAYLEPITRASSEAEVMDPLDPRYIRRKKKEKKRIFKEVYLPAIIACVALFLIISFIVGSVSNALVIRQNKQLMAQQEAQEQATAADREEVEFKALMAEAETLAVGYDYDAAIALLESYSGTNDNYKQQISAKRSELATEQAALVEWKDVSTIANLSFHVLMADASRACDKNVSGDLAGSYNRNFVSVEEFSRILNQLYAANYVLVDFDSFVSCSSGLDGSDSFFTTTMKLPAGKKPIMITETMVNYFEYMVDTDKDGTPDSTGHGFANKLVVDSNGDIKASYVDSTGQELIGNYDLVPVLEAFIQEHPDFSYQGARAILAVTGSEGVFGYRTNTSYVATRGQSYYDQEVADAKVLVEALREKGYTIACYTYSNQAYKSMTTLQIQTEMTNWTNQITPVLGEVDTIVFARSSDIEAYSGTTFNVLYNTGFRYFLNSGTSPRVDVNTTFVKQTRLMVTGEAMAWYSSQFSDYFDCNVVLDISSRGSTPTKS